MPIQVWTPFRADIYKAQGGAALGAGIGQGLQNLGDAIGDMLEKKKQRGQLVQVYRKKLSILNPDRKDEYNEMPLEDLQGEEEAMVAQTLSAKARRSERLDALLAQQRQMSIDDALAQRQVPGEILEAAATNPAMGDFYENPERHPGGRPGLPQEILDVVKAHHRAGAQLDPAILRQVVEGGGGNSLFRPEELGRIRPTDYEGVGFMPTSRGGGQVVTNPNTPQRPGAPIQPRVSVGQNPLTGEPTVTWSGTPEDFEKAFPHLAKPGKAGALPMPKTKAELKTGQQYQTNRGPATWDGEKFTLVK